MVDKIYPSYNDIHNEVILYANNIKQNGIEFDCIIALTRGGSLIGTILSHTLNIPIEYVRYSSQDGEGEKGDNDLLPYHYNRHMLLVDDICDTGNTFSEVIDEYDPCNHITTYSVYYRDTAALIHIPNYSIRLEGDEWIVFPWECTSLLTASEPLFGRK